jgi:multidrug efflux pump subunit AcrA (membrane-fusion protein)
VAERSRSRRRRIRRRRAVAIAVGVLVLAGGGAVALAAAGDSGPSLRVATVQRGSVTQTVESSGTVTSSLKVTPGFAVAGTVASVAAEVGERVRKGQVLARLDATALQSDVDTAQATLADAKQRLEGDRTGQLNTSSATSNTDSSDSAASSRTNSGKLTTSSFSAAELTAAVKPTGPSGPPASSISALSAQVRRAQAALLAAQHAVDQGQVQVDATQHTVDTAVAQNLTLRNAQQTACAADGSSGGTGGTGGTVSAACASAMADYEASADVLSADLATLDTKIAAQDGALKRVDRAIATLDDLVRRLQAAAAASRSTGSGSTRTPSGSTGTSSKTGAGQDPTGANRPSTTTPASATQLAADQAAIDAAAAQLALAQQNLAAATLTSPVAGTVAAVGLSPGSSSSGQTITVIGTGEQGVETSVPLAQLDSVKVGQHVTVSADGVTARLRGTVTSVGLLSTTSGSTTAFPVAVTLAAGSRHLFDGAGADVVIATGSLAGVITVPNSAIHSGARGAHTVSVVSGGTTATKGVTLGLVGADVSQVSSGLRVGQQVVLADLSRSLPSSTTNSNQGFPFGNGKAVIGFVPGLGPGKGGGR